MNESMSNNRLPFAQAALCGTLSGLSARTMTAPLDVAKVTAQVGLQNNVGRSSFLYISQLYKTEGWRALFKGNGAACVRIFPYSAIQYVTYEQLKKPRAGNSGVATGDAAYAGAVAGWAATTATYPLDTVKTRLISQPLNKDRASYSGIGNALRTIKSHEGYRGLFRGLTITLASTVPYGAAMFATYEIMNKHIDKPGHKVTPVQSLYRGMIASSAALTLTYPLDTVRRKLQAYSDHLPNRGGVDLKFHSARSCFAAIYREQGVRGFFRGFLPGLLRVAPYNGILIMSYQAAVNACKATKNLLQPGSYESPDSVEAELKKRQELFNKLPREERRAQIELYGKLLLEALQEVEEEDEQAEQLRKKTENEKRGAGKDKAGK